MKKSAAFALISAAIRAAKCATPCPLSFDRTAPDAARIAQAKSQCTQEAFEVRYVAKIRALNATGKHNLSETSHFAKERVVRKRLQHSEGLRPLRDSAKFELSAVCEFLHGVDGDGIFTSNNDLIALCGYDYQVSMALRRRLIDADLAIQSFVHNVGNEIVQVEGLTLNDRAIQLLMTKSTGKTAHGILSDIKEEEDARVTLCTC